MGATLVEIYDVESGRTYTAPLAAFWEKGFLLDRGFGRQLALPLSEWEVQQTDAPRQLSLLGEPAA